MDPDRRELAAAHELGRDAVVGGKQLRGLVHVAVVGVAVEHEAVDGGGVLEEIEAAVDAFVEEADGADLDGIETRGGGLGSESGGGGESGESFEESAAGRLDIGAHGTTVSENRAAS